MFQVSNIILFYKAIKKIKNYSKKLFYRIVFKNPYQTYLQTPGLAGEGGEKYYFFRGVGEMGSDGKDGKQREI